LASPDPFVQALAGRSHFRVEELLQLTTLIALQTTGASTKIPATAATASVS
jgi:hypothetical protein